MSNEFSIPANMHKLNKLYTEGGEDDGGVTESSILSPGEGEKEERRET